MKDKILSWPIFAFSVLLTQNPCKGGWYLKVAGICTIPPKLKSILMHICQERGKLFFSAIITALSNIYVRKLVLSKNLYKPLNQISKLDSR